jgi:pilus assembly protein CpaE
MPVPKVMVVDPDRESAKELGRLVGQLGFEVVDDVGFGIEAMTAVNALSPDAVLIRVEEPFERSLMTLQRLNEWAPDRPILAYSAQSNLVALRQSMIVGACDYFEARCSPEDLGRAIIRAVEHKAREGMRRRGELPPAVSLGTVVTVFGAKGGIGKTTIATNLAISLARWAEQSVALVDLDTRFGDIAVALDLRVERSMADLVHDLDGISRETLRDSLIRHESGVWVLPAPSRPSEWRHLNVEDVKDVLDILAQTYDFVVIDTPGTFNRFVGISLDVATVVLAITTPEIPSIKDTVVSLDLVGQHFDDGLQKVRILLNQEGMQTGVRTSDIESTIGQPIWWTIPHDVEVMKSTQLGLPVVLGCPDGRAAREFQAMARALSGVLPSAGRSRPGRGRLARMVGRRPRRAA